MRNQFFPEFFLQCCDAIEYIDFGNACASTNNCYGDLRPGGAYYWFSWPARLGLSNNFLIYANFLLLLLSVVLSASALLLINKRAATANFQSSRRKGFMPGASSLVIHLVFLWPTIFTSLSDPPAALFFLNGIWLLLLSYQKPTIEKIFFLLVAGLFLGFSAWIRAFYFYPVLVGVFLCCLSALTKPRRNFAYAIMLSALIPLGFQFSNTYSQYGKWSYFSGNAANDVSNMHLTSTA
ncbi:MAG TPA: hypothetical protein VLB90_05095, partial [Pseudomonadales bacterium]|nr:hypothetical protein [Pseudomonadales bacterium]